MLNISQVVPTDAYPVELYYVPSLDQVWVLNWRGKNDGGIKTIQIIRDAAQKRKHHTVHPEPIDGQFDLVKGLYIPERQVEQTPADPWANCQLYPGFFLNRSRIVYTPPIYPPPFSSAPLSTCALPTVHFFCFVLFTFFPSLVVFFIFLFPSRNSNFAEWIHRSKWGKVN